MRQGIAAVCLSAVALAGCGSATQSSAEKFAGEEAKVAEVVEELQAAGERRDAQKICSDILAAELVDQLEEADVKCVDEMALAIKDADETELEVLEVTVTGTKATARVKGQEGEEDRFATFEFTKERGAWRATSLAAGS